MPIINLRSQYPHLSEDIFMEISDPIFEVYDHSRKQINNYDRRARYHRAFYSLDVGDGFGAARLTGSQYNDPYAFENGRVVTLSNHAGGLLGGITNGMPVIVRAAFRPTPSISLEQQTVSLSGQRPETLAVHGRHDPCVAVRAVPVVESAVALSLLELWLERRATLPLARRKEGL